ncbi:MAG TPA: OmpA family protein [Terriglobales bacterium]|jgi:OOP family OmpA-OmpF porin|nr:OmpA family protein [Terriglobales bacterium]
MKTSLCLGLLLCVHVAAAQSAGKNASQRNDIMGMVSGAVLLSSSGEYNGKWMALNLLDGTNTLGWCSPGNKPLPHTFIIELAQPYHLNSLVLDNTNAQDSGYPGISARAVELWVSSTSSESGYKKIATLEATQSARKEFPLPAGSEARWVKLVVVSNWGNKQYTELMEVEAYGSPTGAPVQRPPLSGAYDTNYGALQITQDGSHVTGCYYNGDGQISGSSDGRTINAEWRQKNGNGTMLMTLSSRGDFLNGVWYAKGELQGAWFGTRRSGPQKVCDDTRNTLSQQLKQGGRAILYGIHFDSDSANLRPDSEPTLRQVMALMQSQPGLRLSIEGHTDSTNTAAYNLDLSRRRAQAVVDWLVKNGMTAGRLASQGFGSSRPVADNNSPQGRALNRRVELVAQN